GDCHHCLDRLGAVVKPQAIRPICTGENATNRQRLTDFIINQGCDILNPDLRNTGGFDVSFRGQRSSNKSGPGTRTPCQVACRARHKIDQANASNGCAEVQDAGYGPQGDMGALLGIQSDPCSDGGSRKAPRYDATSTEPPRSAAISRSISARAEPSSGGSCLHAKDSITRGDRISPCGRPTRSCRAARGQTPTQGIPTDARTEKARPKPFEEGGLRLRPCHSTLTHS